MASFRLNVKGRPGAGEERQVLAAKRSAGGGEHGELSSAH